MSVLILVLGRNDQFKDCPGPSSILQACESPFTHEKCDCCSSGHPFEVAQIRLMLSRVFGQWVKDLQPRGGGMQL